MNRVLIIHSSFEVYGGAELAIVKLAQSLLKKNINVTILTTMLPEKVSEELKGCFAVVTNNWNELKKWLDINYQRFDIINSHNNPSQLLLYPNKWKHVWYCNEPPESVLHNNYLRPEEKMLCNESINRIIVADKFNQERIKKFYDMDSTIVPYGTDYDFWIQGEGKRAEEYYNLKPNDFVVVHPGWFNPFKNQLRTLDAIEKLKDKISNLKIVFSGCSNSPYYFEVVNQINKRNLNKYIVIETELGRFKLRDLYARANLVIFPYGHQGGFLSVFDSLCLNKNIIVFPTTSCANIIKDNNLGIVSDKLEEFILNSYNNPNIINENLSKWVKENMTWENYCEGVYKIFEELI